MIARHHTLLGLASGIAVAAGFGLAPDQIVMAAALGAWASLLPDLDHPQGTIASLLPITGWIVDRLTKHRGLTHRLELGLLLMLGGILAWLYFLLASPLVFAAGYFSHLIGDSITRRGIPLLRWRFYLLPTGFRPRTGGCGEVVVCYLISTGLLIWAFLRIQLTWWW